MATTTTFDGPLPGGSDGATVRVHPLLCGEIPAPPQYFERPKGRLGLPRAIAGALTTPRSRWRTLPLPAFLVEHPTAGPVVVDTGPSPLHATDPKADMGRVGGALFAARMRPDQAAGAQVRALGHDPAQIERVVMTHLHWDHLGGAGQFPDAEFLVTRTEHDDAPSPLKGTPPHHREPVRSWRLIDGPGEPHGPFSRTHDLFGDGSMRLVWTPGHTPGHVAVLLRLAGGRSCLLTGDAVYDRRALDQRLVPLLCPDVPTYLRSLDELRAFVAAEPDAIVVCGHDPDRWAQDGAAAAAAGEAVSAGR
jgi:N-acyl homoserine lactone hydrolase